MMFNSIHSIPIHKLATMPAKSLGTLTSISKVKTNHPPLPHGTMLVYYQTGLDFRKHFLLRFFCDISLNHQHCFRGKRAEVPIFFHERNERYQMQRKFMGVPSTFGRHCTFALSSFQGSNYFRSHGLTPFQKDPLFLINNPNIDKLCPSF